MEKTLITVLADAVRATRIALKAKVYDLSDLLTTADGRGTLFEPNQFGPRTWRTVFITAGTHHWSYLGPEEGGTYGNVFHEIFRVPITVNTESEVLSALRDVDYLLSLTARDETDEPVIYLTTGGYYRQEPYRYE